MTVTNQAEPLPFSPSGNQSLRVDESLANANKKLAESVVRGNTGNLKSGDTYNGYLGKPSNHPNKSSIGTDAKMRKPELTTSGSILSNNINKSQELVIVR